MSVLPICDLHFGCGCKLPGFGGYDHCDVMILGPPDCPWCTHSEIFWVSLSVTLLSSFVVTIVASARFGLFGTVAITTLVQLLTLVLAGIGYSVISGLPILAGL